MEVTLEKGFTLQDLRKYAGYDYIFLQGAALDDAVKLLLDTKWAGPLPSLSEVVRITLIRGAVEHQRRTAYALGFSWFLESEVRDVTCPECERVYPAHVHRWCPRCQAPVPPPPKVTAQAVRPPTYPETIKQSHDQVRAATGHVPSAYVPPPLPELPGTGTVRGDLMKELGMHVRYYRKARALSLGGLGARVGWRPDMLSRLERGKYSLLTLPNVYRLAAALQVEPSKLLPSINQVPKLGE